MNKLQSIILGVLVTLAGVVALGGLVVSVQYMQEGLHIIRLVNAGVVVTNYGGVVLGLIFGYSCLLLGSVSGIGFLGALVTRPHV